MTYEPIKYQVLSDKDTIKLLNEKRKSKYDEICLQVKTLNKGESTLITYNGVIQSLANNLREHLKSKEVKVKIKSLSYNEILIIKL